ncbi:hypothetical protein MNBD_ALPHA12-1878 [hydrothermal vent metagenome]|uniref:FAD dependent oxidoreductase domain-containing protein n=1 Tax=hydrothermal vent metagenome TaxID=652676 RepID=A0A3B0TZD9_9ZZZZ
MNYPDSYYVEEATATIRQEAPWHTDELPKEVDTIVVGGGFAGLTTALELARSGKSVALFEANKIGWGASGRNGGFVSEGFAQGLPALISRLGHDHAKALVALSISGGEFVRRQANSIDPAIIGGHGWLLAYRHHDPEAVKKTQALYNAHGMKRRIVERSELRELLKSQTYFEALENSRAFHIQPLTYALGLAQKAHMAGAGIFENCAVDALDKNGALWQASAAGKIIKAQHVVLAGSAYMSGLYPRLQNAILPVATYVVATEPMARQLDKAISYSGAISDNRRAGDYYRRLKDGRLLWGGRITTRRSEPKKLAQMLKSDIDKIYPQLGDFKISHAWSGLMGYAAHKMPIIGELESGIWAVTGFGGHGLSTTAMGGQLIASAIAEGDDRWRQFSSFGPVWAGGALGRAAVQAIYWFMQGRDRIEEKRKPHFSKKRDEG